MMDLRGEMRAKYGSPKPEPQASREEAFDTEALWTPERAFVVRADSGRTIITAPAREIAQANSGFTYLRGRFVGADEPNRNKAMWSTADLEMGAPTVAGGPLNWLHQERKIIGSLLSGDLVSGKEAAAEGVGNYIMSTAAAWRFLFPHEVAAVEKAAADGSAFFSMECVSRQVACVGENGCGASFDYADYDAKRACSHLNDRTSVRQFVDPVFLGGAVIVPPVRPGWANANLDIMRQAAAVDEEYGISSGNMTRPEAESLVAQILTWANRDAAASFSAEERKQMAKSGVAMSDGSYPIRNATDLHNAINDYNRTGQSSAVKAHIIARAKALHITEDLPDGWV